MRGWIASPRTAKIGATIGVVAGNARRGAHRRAGERAIMGAPSGEGAAGRVRDSAADAPAGALPAAPKETDRAGRGRIPPVRALFAITTARAAPGPLVNHASGVNVANAWVTPVGHAATADARLAAHRRLD